MTSDTRTTAARLAITLDQAEREAVDYLRGRCSRSAYTRAMIGDLTRRSSRSRERLAAVPIEQLRGERPVRLDVRLRPEQLARFQSWCGGALRPSHAIRAEILERLKERARTRGQRGASRGAESQAEILLQAPESRDPVPLDPAFAYGFLPKENIPMDSPPSHADQVPSPQPVAAPVAPAPDPHEMAIDELAARCQRRWGTWTEEPGERLLYLDVEVEHATDMETRGLFEELVEVDVDSPILVAEAWTQETELSIGELIVDEAPSEAFRILLGVANSRDGYLVPGVDNAGAVVERIQHLLSRLARDGSFQIREHAVIGDDGGYGKLIEVEGHVL